MANVPIGSGAANSTLWRIVPGDTGYIFEPTRGGNPRPPPPELVEADGVFEQMIEDHGLPLAVDQIERSFHRAARPAREIPSLHEGFPGFSQ